MKWMLLLIVVSEFKRVRPSKPDQAYTEASGRKFMENLNKEGEIWANRMSNALWDYDSNLTDYNLRRQLKVSSQYAIYYKEKVKELNRYHWMKFRDPVLKREFEFSASLGTAALPEKKLARYDELIAKMADIYSTTKLVEWQSPDSGENNTQQKPTLSLEPDLVDIFARHDSCRLQYYWEGWHATVGRSEKPLFEEYVLLNNEAAKLNGFPDAAALWIDDFEMEHFDRAIHKLYEAILPFYQQLHAYVRRRLARHYNSQSHKLIDEHGSLPVHILGDLWAQQWGNVYGLTVPFPAKKSVDVTSTMKEKNFTPLKMFKMAEEFYTSLNLSAMTETFWKKSIIEKPNDREMVCHASAWDFNNGDDYRIKMCTRVNMEEFKTIHHEMGHIQYFMQYKDQPYVFREGANSGFHEAIGDTIALSVSTAQHLARVGLLDPDTYSEDKEADINALYLMALDKVAFLPFAYILDLWRWEIFKGKTTPEKYNCRYWELRQKLQGIVPPVDRSANDFDGGAKYHVIADVPYIRYFISFIIQFQFHKALCIKAGQYRPKHPASKPLHQCDIYRSKEAGRVLGKMLRMGASRPPQEAMRAVTGQETIDAGPLLEYFRPLHDWLVRDNRRHGVTIGWADHHTACAGGLTAAKSTGVANIWSGSGYSEVIAGVVIFL